MIPVAPMRESAPVDFHGARVLVLLVQEASGADAVDLDPDVGTGLFPWFILEGPVGGLSDRHLASLDASRRVVHTSSTSHQRIVVRTSSRTERVPVLFGGPFSGPADGEFSETSAAVTGLDMSTAVASGVRARQARDRLREVPSLVPP